MSALFRGALIGLLAFGMLALDFEDSFARGGRGGGGRGGGGGGFSRGGGGGFSRGGVGGFSRGGGGGFSRGGGISRGSSGGFSRGLSGGGGVRSFSGGSSRSFGGVSPRSFSSGGSTRGFSGGSPTRGFSSGGSTRSFGGGNAGAIRNSVPSLGSSGRSNSTQGNTPSWIRSGGSIRSQSPGSVPGNSAGSIIGNRAGRVLNQGSGGSVRNPLGSKQTGSWSYGAPGGSTRSGDAGVGRSIRDVAKPSGGGNVPNLTRSNNGSNKGTWEFGNRGRSGNGPTGTAGADVRNRVNDLRTRTNDIVKGRSLDAVNSGRANDRGAAAGVPTERRGNRSDFLENAGRRLTNATGDVNRTLGSRWNSKFDDQRWNKFNDHWKFGNFDRDGRGGGRNRGDRDGHHHHHHGRGWNNRNVFLSFYWGGYPGWGWGLGYGYPYYGYYGNPSWFLYGYPYYGYGAYVNPYCYYSVPAAYGYVDQFDYSQPLPVAADDQVAQQPSQPLVEAQAAFRNGDYQRALELVTKAAQEVPGDRDVHQFRSLVFFAIGDYERASAAAYAALSVGPGWDWPSLRSFYADGEEYTRQLRLLERYTTEHPDEAATQFLLAYHYLMLGHEDAARARLEKAVKLEPKDKVSAGLLQMLSGGAVEPPVPPPPTTNEPGGTDGNQGQTPEKPSDAVAGAQPTLIAPGNELVPQAPNRGPDLANRPVAAPKPAARPLADTLGAWTANPDPEASFKMELRDDGTFTWTFSAGSEKHSFTGTYTLNGDRLTLSRSGDGEKLVGKVTWKGEKSFNFKLDNSPPEDTGLDFTKG